MTASDLRDDPRLTAYALGELDAAQRIELEHLLAADLAACAEMQAIAAWSTVLGAELGREAGAVAGLTAAQRAAIGRAAATSPGAPASRAPIAVPARSRRRAWLIPVCGAALAAGIVAVVLMNHPTGGPAAPIPITVSVAREAESPHLAKDGSASAKPTPTESTPVIPVPTEPAPVADAGIGASEHVAPRPVRVEVVRDSTSDIRVVFGRSLQSFDNPDAVGVAVEVNKLIRDARGENGKWLAKPVEWKLNKPGVPLDFTQKVPDPQEKGSLREERFETPFVLSAVHTDVRRILYYEIVAKARLSGGRQRDLDIKIKEVGTETATLENTKTNQKLELLKLTKIQRPGRPDAVIFPDFGVPVYDEAEEFRKNPATLQQWGLIPPAPIEHDPDTGPLEDMRKKSNDVRLKTDTKYYELADGRLAYWDNVDCRLQTVAVPDAAADLKPAQVDAPAVRSPVVPESGGSKSPKPNALQPPANPPAR